MPCITLYRHIRAARLKHDNLANLEHIASYLSR
jgi:hypothetical protein